MLPSDLVPLLVFVAVVTLFGSLIEEALFREQVSAATTRQRETTMNVQKRATTSHWIGTRRRSQAGCKVFFKSCPRCRGDLIDDADALIDEETYACLQCGWNGAPHELSPSRKQV